MKRSNAVSRGGFACAMAEPTISKETRAEQSIFIVIHLFGVSRFTNGQLKLYNHEPKRAARIPLIRRFALLARTSKEMPDDESPMPHCRKKKPGLYAPAGR